ncbi:hypothetical protein HPP92_018492 [Vanilla planifolia]|uniref:Uncharacterized protein n=1 Tax=Vanilla planifolia TaxID=51239 RepID=A0A835UMY4_VANPL|nr:hypothetical protein HPP92_019109 [Vanilla planifolia]KAG0469164.1 hypothetical protein HPP92_018492 [Vanilla planifolia]
MADIALLVVEDFGRMKRRENGKESGGWMEFSSAVAIASSAFFATGEKTAEQRVLVKKETAKRCWEPRSFLAQQAFGGFFSA